MSKNHKPNAGAQNARVKICIDLETHGAQQRTELPVVTAVMAPLSGKSQHAQVPLADRKFMPIDIDNFDLRMKSIRPRVVFAVPNHLTGDGSLLVDISFECMDDFLPDAIAAKVPALRELLQMRTRLANLLTWQDGKPEAEDFLNQLMQDKPMLEKLATRHLPGPAA